MYGVTATAMREMPRELAGIRTGDIVFISEREVSNNALFGPFYVISDRPHVFTGQRQGSWAEIDTQRTHINDRAYWVEFEKRKWCLLFDMTLLDKISIVWPYHWSRLRLNLPSWGAVSGEDSDNLLDFAIRNEEEARAFLRRHDVW
jgi:hypothetical protein